MSLPTLQEARLKSGWNQRSLAQVADCSVMTISNLETGKHSPNSLTRRRIEIALGTGIDWRATLEQGIIKKNGNQIIKES